MNKWISLFFMFFCSFLHSQHQIKFSHEAGFYDDPFYLKIDNSTGKVMYTYQNNLSRRSKVLYDSLLIDKNTTISFGLYHGDSIIHLGSKSYFINFKTKFNIVSLTISNRSLYDSISGIYVDGPNAKYDSSLSLVTGCSVMLNSNYSRNSERDIYVEIFDTKGNRIVNQEAGICIFGGLSRYYPEKSLRIIARRKYGNSRFHANIFNQGKKKYKQFVLRHSGNDYRRTRFKDVLSTTIASESGIDVQANQPSHLFVNSVYWGVYNIREKLNEYYINNNYDCGTESVDMLQGAYKNVVEEGSGAEYNHLLDFIADNDLQDITNYEYVKTLMDVENFANFWIHQIYIGNIDARGNIRFWRSDSLDGRFRWIFYDTDLGWENYKSTLLEDFTSPKKTKWYNPTWATFLLRNLLKNIAFKNYFINQTSYLLHTNLSVDSVTRKINYFETIYKDEMVYHFNHKKKFESYQGNIKRWQKEVNKLKSFALKRSNKLLSQIQKKFNLSDSYKLSVIIENLDNGKVLLNNNELKSPNFVGRFFAQEKVSLSVIPNIGYSYAGRETDFIINKENHDTIIYISFIRNKESDMNVIFNEIDYQNDCFEIYSKDQNDLDLNGWIIIDKNKNKFIIQDLTIKNGNFVVFHKNHIKDKLKEVNYQKIDFKISSVAEELFLYDDKGRLVDAVDYAITSKGKSYSRKIPYNSSEEMFKDLESENMLEISINQTNNWENNFDVPLTLGYENTFFTNIKLEIEKQKERKRMFIIITSSVAGALLIISLFFLIRKRKKKKIIS